MKIIFYEQKGKSKSMKRFFYLMLTLLFTITGCSNETLVNSDSISSGYKLIKLPAQKGLALDNMYSNSKQITGSTGGGLCIQGSYSGGPFGTVTMNSTLEFPAGAFNGTKTITMTADDEYCASSFSPGMSFTLPGIYNITYTGVDLSGINPSTVKFVYLKENGNLEYPSHDGIVVNQAIGKIQVINARMNHFSRYGFVN